MRRKFTQYNLAGFHIELLYITGEHVSDARLSWLMKPPLIEAGIDVAALISAAVLRWARSSPTRNMTGTIVFVPSMSQQVGRKRVVSDAPHHD